MDIEDFIKQLRETDHYISTIYYEGGCYRFACLLESMFGGEVVISKEKDHAALLLNGKVYDIKGKQDPELFESPCNFDLIEMNDWSFAKYRILSIGECGNCEEPILINGNIK